MRSARAGCGFPRGEASPPATTDAAVAAVGRNADGGLRAFYVWAAVVVDEALERGIFDWLGAEAVHAGVFARLRTPAFFECVLGFARVPSEG